MPRRKRRYGDIAVLVYDTGLDFMRVYLTALRKPTLIPICVCARLDNEL
jgi:hypothetical protein